MDNNTPSQYKLIDSRTNADIALDGDFILVGRADKCDIKPDADGISNYHAAFLNKKKKFFLIDLSSSNGTYLNGRRIAAPVLLSHNDSISFDRLEMRFIDSEMRSDTVLREKPEASPEHISHQPGLQSPKTPAGSPVEKAGDYPRLFFLNITKEPEIIVKDYITAGRSEKCDIAIPEPSMSREHFVIRRMGKEFYIQNLSASNVTKVNGIPIDNQKLNGDELIKAGFVEMKITLPMPGIQDAPTTIEKIEENKQNKAHVGEPVKEAARDQQENKQTGKTEKASEVEEIIKDVPGDSEFTGHYIKTELKKKGKEK